MTLWAKPFNQSKRKEILCGSGTAYVSNSRAVTLYKAKLNSRHINRTLKTTVVCLHQCEKMFFCIRFKKYSSNAETPVYSDFRSLEQIPHWLVLEKFFNAPLSDCVSPFLLSPWETAHLASLQLQFLGKLLFPCSLFLSYEATHTSTSLECPAPSYFFLFCFWFCSELGASWQCHSGPRHQRPLGANPENWRRHRTAASQLWGLC